GIQEPGVGRFVAVWLPAEAWRRHELRVCVDGVAAGAAVGRGRRNKLIPTGSGVLRHGCLIPGRCLRGPGLMTAVAGGLECNRFMPSRGAEPGRGRVKLIWRGGAIASQRQWLRT